MGLETGQAPYFTYDLVFSVGTIQQADYSATYPLSQGVDGLTATQAQIDAAGVLDVDLGSGGDATVTGWGIARHDVSTQSGTIHLEHSANGSSWTTLDSVTPATDAPISRIVTSTTDRYWRIRNSGASAVLVGDVTAGTALLLPTRPPVGFVRPEYADNQRLEVNKTKSGNVVGFTLRGSGYATTINLKYLSESWIESNWDSFLAVAKTRPFYFMWDQTSHASNVFFCWIDGDLPQPKYSHTDLLSVSLKLSGVIA